MNYYKYAKYKQKYYNLQNSMIKHNLQNNIINSGTKKINQIGGYKHKTYYVHSNRNRPFKVVMIDENKVHIYKDQAKIWEKSIFEDTPILEFDVERIFIGTSPKNKMTMDSGDYGPKNDGNTILLHTKDNEYVYIGAEVCMFKTETDRYITQYISPIGNNDVPYPYAIDNDQNYYLIIENVIISDPNISTSVSISISTSTSTYDNPYDYYYDYNMITSEISRTRPKQPKPIDWIHDIKEWYVGDEKSTMRYTPFPGKHYDMLVNNLEHMYIIDSANKKTKLARKSYIKLMQVFGKKRGFVPLITTTIEPNPYWS